MYAELAHFGKSTLMTYNDPFANCIGDVKQISVVTAVLKVLAILWSFLKLWAGSPYRVPN